MYEWFKPVKKTFLYHVNPGLKFLIIVGLLLIALLNQSNEFAWKLALFSFTSMIFLTGYPFYKLLLLNIPTFISMISTFITMLLFGRGEIIWWKWGIFKITEESFHFGLLLVYKTASFGFLSIILLLTTHFILLFYALMQQFKFPSKYAYSFIAAIRLVPMIIEEFQTRKNAMKVRRVPFSKGIRGLYERLSFFSVPLLAESIRRAQRVAVAMEAKQYQMGQTRTYYYATPYTKQDKIFLISFLLLFSLLLISVWY